MSDTQEVTFTLDIIESVENILKKKKFSNLVVISDANAYKHHLRLFNQLAFSLPFFLIEIPGGEGCKSRKMKHQIEDTMLKNYCDRNTLMIAIGGGASTDLAGFVAATYMRGISWVAVPTTLMGMIDAAIGGKTGINTSYGKNLIGAFHLPLSTIIYPEFLKTLDQDNIDNALYEIIKYGCIANPHLLQAKELFKNGPINLIEQCITIKLRFIKGDFTDQNQRQHLNYGHTIGHALEKLSDYTLSHGKAVGMGLLVETKINLLKDNIKASAYQLLYSSINKIGLLPIYYLKEYEKLYSFALQDKKNHNQMCFISKLTDLGRIKDMQAITFKDIKLACKEISDEMDS